MRHTVSILFMLLIAASALADDGEVPRRPSNDLYTGLSVTANAGAFWASDVNANFYNGRPENANTIERVLYSNTYGQRIWENLKNQGLISSAIGNYNNLVVVEYPNMYYKISYLIGVGIRYDYASGFGWLLGFDMVRLQAVGAFNLSSNNGTGILSNNGQYIRCGMLGKEDRIQLYAAIAKTVPLSGMLNLELNLGAQLNNTRVKDQLMEIGGANYKILDIWGGRSPDYGVGNYEYINQGGIGWGLFMSAWLGYRVPGIGAIKVGYTCHHAKTVLEGYTAMGWHHSLSVRIEINNFSFI